jgi:hypothetical protein
MATQGRGRIERRLAAILAAGIRRREFMATLLFAATLRRAQAQQPARVYRIAVVNPSRSTAMLSETGGLPTYEAFFKELRRLGYIEGQNLVVERHSGEGRTEHYAELAREVVRSNPDLIFTLQPAWCSISKPRRPSFQSSRIRATQSPLGWQRAWHGQAPT